MQGARFPVHRPYYRGYIFLHRAAWILNNGYVVSLCSKYAKHRLPARAVRKRSMNEEDVFHRRRLRIQPADSEGKDDGDEHGNRAAPSGDLAAPPAREM
jgi:hypothetical protein